MNEFTIRLAVFIVGTILGHWFAIHRDRRKEFNEIADRIFRTLDDQLRCPSPYNAISEDDIRMLRRMITAWRRTRFDKAMIEYEQDTGESNQRYHDMQSLYIDGEKVQNAATKLMKWFPHR